MELTEWWQTELPSPFHALAEEYFTGRVVSGAHNSFKQTTAIVPVS